MADLETIDLYWLAEPKAEMPEITGRTALIHRLYRRYNTRRARFPWWPNDGLDVQDYLLAKKRPEDIAREVRLEGEKDECVDSIVVDASFVAGHLTLALTVDDGDGPFDFTLDVTAARVALVGLPEAG